jgi:hypothetical protein
MLENSVLRTILGSKKDKMKRGRRKERNEERHNLFSSRSIIRISNERSVNTNLISHKLINFN